MKLGESKFSHLDIPNTTPIELSTAQLSYIDFTYKEDLK
jgi:hypothetical protein